MRFLISVGLFVVSSSGAYSQHRGGFAPVGPPVSRGGPPMGARSPRPSWGATAPIGVQPTVPTWGAQAPIGVGPPTGVRPPGAWWGRGHGRSSHWGGGDVPYLVPYPVYSNGGYYPEIPYPYEQPFPPHMAGMPLQQPDAPVIVNQYLPESSPIPPAEQPTVQVYQAPASPQPYPPESQRSTLFIALKDGWVYTASDYWVEHGTLHYITSQGRHNQASLDLVDRLTSARLNSGKEFHLPPP